ncbi:MAG: aldolase/citrate lyase family protein [Anaerolineales bacterium]
MHSRRALLYMPGDDRRKIEKATTLGVDSICMDMEDGVAVNRKAEARHVIAHAMKELNFGSSERCIRINSIGSGFEVYDLAAALEAEPDTIVVPKIETAEQVIWVSERIEFVRTGEQLEHRQHPPAGRRGNSEGNYASTRDRRSRETSRSHYFRRGGFRRIHRRGADQIRDGVVVRAAGGGHGLCGERPASHRHRLHRFQGPGWTAC